ncbi:MAG: sugar transferase [Ardenticatenaceae bacterium]|nr:sugar transferase [Ardenticatenaceae bacterium]
MRLNTRPIRILTFLTDILLINLAFYLAHMVRYDFQFPASIQTYHPFGAYQSQQILLNFFMLAAFWQLKVWRRRRGEFWIDEVGRLVAATAVGIALMIIYVFVAFPTAFSRYFWALVPIFIVVLLAVARAGRRWFLNILYLRGWWTDPVLIVGAGETGRGVLRTILARPDLGFRPIGFMHDGQQYDMPGLGKRIPDLGRFDDLPRVLQTEANLHSVFIALPAAMHQQTTRLIRICRQHNVAVQVAPDMFQLSLSRVEFTNMAGIPVLGMREVRFGALNRLLKRLLDAVLVIIGAVPALTVGALIALAIKLDSSGPVFYVAERIGRNGKPFRMYKFRSMVVDADSQKSALAQLNEAEGPIFKIRDDPRLTRVGRLIRRLSLDELPQLINVMRGEMSLVGPRPPLKEEVDQYQSWHKQRLAVRGGITGLWQVSGRSDLTFDEQCLLDIYYIENWSLSLDLRIIVQTIPYALFGRGAY